MNGFNVSPNKTLDRERPFSVVRGDPLNRFIQDGLYFDAFGKFTGPVNPHYVSKNKTLDAPAPVKNPSKQGTKSRHINVGKPKDLHPKSTKALERAVAHLGKAGAVSRPNEVEEALRENARAEAAEGLAE